MNRLGCNLITHTNSACLVVRGKLFMQLDYFLSFCCLLNDAFSSTYLCSVGLQDYQSKLRLWLHNCICSLNTILITLIKHFQINTATNCRSITCINVRGRLRMSERSFCFCVSYYKSTENILMWTCEVQRIMPFRRFKIHYLCVLFVWNCVKCQHGPIIREHSGIESNMKKTGGVNVIKVYVWNYETSLLILCAFYYSGCKFSLTCRLKRQDIPFLSCI